MPRIQTAQVAVADFGAPVAIGTVAVFSAKKGGVLDVLFTNDEGDGDLTVSLEVSPDNASYAATTTAANGAAVTGVVVKPKCTSQHRITLRQGLDLFVRIRASGGQRGQMQYRGDTGLDIVQL